MEVIMGHHQDGGDHMINQNGTAHTNGLSSRIHCQVPRGSPHSRIFLASNTKLYIPVFSHYFLSFYLNLPTKFMITTDSIRQNSKIDKLYGGYS